MMKNIALLIAVTVLSMACSNSNKTTESKEVEVTQEMVDGIKITNLTMQEYVSGVEGGKNTIEFLLNADMGGQNMELDSLFFIDYACKLYVKDAETGLYKASSTKSENDMRTMEIKPIRFSMKGSSLSVSVMETEMKVLDPVHMP